MRLIAATTAMLLGVLILAGCQNVDPHQGYTSANLHQDDIQTVCVEMFQSQSFHRGIEFDLTRAIAQQIETHTPYKVMADRTKADSVIYGTITKVSESSLQQQRRLDRPLENRVVLWVEVNWKDLRNGIFLMENQTFRVSSDYLQMLGAGRDSAQRQAANEMAVRIVEAMEKDW